MGSDIKGQPYGDIGYISIHAPRVGSDPKKSTTPWMTPRFQSTLPVWGATVYTNSTQIYMIISIHAPRVGSDGARHPHRAGHHNFNPRSPCGERPATPATLTAPCAFQSTLPVWGATDTRTPASTARRISIHAPRVGSDDGALRGYLGGHISIHAPRVGSDLAAVRTGIGSGISIHAPRVGSDMRDYIKGAMFHVFQSTLPVWGATCSHCRALSRSGYFNPRSPCGERP